MNVTDGELVIYWFRRDLRLTDNHALYRALVSGGRVQPVFIFDTSILSQIENKEDARVTFIHERLSQIQSLLEPYGSSIKTYFGDPEKIWKEILSTYAPKAVFANRDYEPLASQRDQEIENLLSRSNVDFYLFKDQVIFDRAEIVKGDGTPYTVYTPYKNKWIDRLEQDETQLLVFPSLEQLDMLYPSKHVLHTLSQIGFRKSNIEFPPDVITGDIITHYPNTRDIPGLDKGTSRLGLHLRFGTISIRNLVSKAYANQDRTFLSELIWREFFMMNLWHFPNMINTAFYKKYDYIIWENDTLQFEAWCKGKTGYPLVDAGMRELNATGFMHNRVRMLTASFLCKHLLIDWRWGEAYFAQKLLDYDQSANVGNWQWAAGCGMDAAPYFRIFNPTLQLKKFDPQLIYIKKWVPEFQELTYPQPIVDHSWARERALARYKSALSNS
ncbi:cryptochrome/photolyase family protein [Sphingobacterium sp. SYP-B4668]|uniref:cryptochrome/photolyase family protein n=1 Tax=Sphingobacterium sp. SYP-B4668 TaxID=2996035 RepID=UPI0022DE6561|nr:deoxyribodipyrimidine photo-lyase [Sphingobacterium sp. SYP-B4668]